MSTLLERERLVEDVIRTSMEASTTDDLSAKILPLLGQLLEVQGSFLYQVDEQGAFLPLGGNLKEIGLEYSQGYISQDPIQRGLRRLCPRIQRVSLLQEWEAYRKSEVYNEFARPKGIDDFFHLILEGAGLNQPGMVALMLARNHRQKAFEERDSINLARVFPALEALVRRSSLAHSRLRTYPVLESMLDAKSPPTLALNIHGKLLWGSDAAIRLLNLRTSGGNNIPDILVEAARRLGPSARGSSSSPPTFVVVPRQEAPPLRGELRMAKTRSGEPFVIVEFENNAYNSFLQEAAHRAGLTKAETEVLGLLALALSDREISQRLCISLPTVRSHVGHILAKLNARSRMQAALMAHGNFSPTDRESD